MVSAAPLTSTLGANFEDKIEVTEVSIRPGQLRPGEQAHASLTLRVRSAIDRDYQVFVHIENPENPSERLNADHKALGGARPTTDWKPGETLRDEFLIYVPPNSTARSLNVWFGFWHPDTGLRLRLSNPNSLRNDGQNRVLLAQVPIAP
jgi:hypothetical protein